MGIQNEMFFLQETISWHSRILNYANTLSTIELVSLNFSFILTKERVCFYWNKTKTIQNEAYEFIKNACSRNKYCSL